MRNRMMLRTSADVIRACDYGTDLNELLVKYFKLWAKYCQGINGVNVPAGPFWVQVLRPISEEALLVRLAGLSAEIKEREIRTPVYDLGSTEADGAEGIWYHDVQTVFDKEEIFEGTLVKVLI